jgi:hypothetical protein
MHFSPPKFFEGIGNRGGRTYHHQAGLLQHACNIEGNEELVLDDQYAGCCHRSYSVASTLKTRGRRAHRSWIAIDLRMPASPNSQRGTRLGPEAFVFNLSEGYISRKIKEAARTRGR